MAKGDCSEGKWCCPILNKEFTSSSHIVANKITGNVFSYEAVQELNLKCKNLEDLISGEPFTRADLITLHLVGGWKWKYHYHYPPLFADLCKYVPHFETNFVEQQSTSRSTQSFSPHQSYFL